MTARGTWQQEETAVTRLFGGEFRRAQSAKSHRAGAGFDDAGVRNFAVEVKLHKQLGFQALWDAILQAESAAETEGEGKTAIAVARRPGDRKTDRMACLRLSTLLELLGIEPWDPDAFVYRPDPLRPTPAALRRMFDVDRNDGLIRVVHRPTDYTLQFNDYKTTTRTSNQEVRP